MIIGFTGTRKGMTARQLERLRDLIREHQPREFRHGDCVGADEQAHVVVRLIDAGIRIVVHPPTDAKLRAFCDGDAVLDPEPYLIRNQRIVEACELLIAAPEPGPPRLRSGTWSTHRYGLKLKRKVEVLKP